MSKTALVAIVDDDESTRETTKDLLESAGFSAICFACAEDLLKSRRLRSFSCLIADMRMRGMTGFELHLRLAASSLPIPTILITAYPDEADRARAIRAGVVCYLAKPFAADELLNCLRCVVSRWDGASG